MTQARQRSTRTIIEATAGYLVCGRTSDVSTVGIAITLASDVRVFH